MAAHPASSINPHRYPDNNAYQEPIATALSTYLSYCSSFRGTPGPGVSATAAGLAYELGSGPGLVKWDEQVVKAPGIAFEYPDKLIKRNILCDVLPARRPGHASAQETLQKVTSLLDSHSQILLAARAYFVYARAVDADHR
ncbi:hypothetical protein N7470_003101 [Penicillium chermesinum]|nr:hypothetical protein N7470_003101 [Penicillium chermesinum]